MGSKLLPWAVVLAIAATAAIATAQSLCGTAVATLSPCEAYLLGSGPGVRPTGECCAAAQQLSAMANTAETRRELCQCLKDTGPSFGVRPERASSLPSLCGIRLSLPISANVDCNKI